MKIALGDKVKDKITGFTGIATGRAEYLTGCIRFYVERPGKEPKADWYDEERLIQLQARAHSHDKTYAPAGPRDSPSRASAPSR